jgi:hypothetical protein
MQSFRITVPTTPYVSQVEDTPRLAVGSFTFESGEVYDGQWHDKLLDGHGKFTDANGW